MLAYGRIDEGATHAAEVCGERAHLSVDHGWTRAAFAQVQCVLEFGARGRRFFESWLKRASLLAHLARYEASVARYLDLAAHIVREQCLFATAVARLSRTSVFLFEVSERSTRDHEGWAVSGAVTLFGDA